MKKLSMLSAGIILFIVSCTSGDTNSPVSTVYTYETKKVIQAKSTIEAGSLQTELNFNKVFSYVIDTVEIKLNGFNAGSLGTNLEITTWDSMTTYAQNVTPHVNYIKFIDLRTRWEDNKSKRMLLIDKNNSSPHRYFSYSECNIILNNYPQFFVTNTHIPTYTTLEVKPKVTNNIEIFKSNSLYNVGDIISRDGMQYKVISKK